MLHADIDVVGPGAGIGPALRPGQHMPGMRPDVVDRLVLPEQFDRAVDPACHGVFLRELLACGESSMPAGIPLAGQAIAFPKTSFPAPTLAVPMK